MGKFDGEICNGDLQMINKKTNYYKISIISYDLSLISPPI
jgi:hypothetical protein